MRSFLLLLVTTLLGACAHADTCDSPSNQREMTRCSFQELQELEDHISKETAYLMTVVPAENDIEAINKLWSTYRNTHCESVSQIYSGGSLYDFALIQCKIEQSKIRLNSLKSNYKDTVDIVTKGAP